MRWAMGSVLFGLLGGGFETDRVASWLAPDIFLPPAVPWHEMMVFGSSEGDGRLGNEGGRQPSGGTRRDARDDMAFRPRRIRACFHPFSTEFELPVTSISKHGARHGF